MARYLYIFSYQTPAQMEVARAQEAVDEASEAVFIEANTAEQALDWGREISEAFFHQFTGNDHLSWKSLNFAHWIESQPEIEYPGEVLAGLPGVVCGKYPDFAGFKPQSRACGPENS